MGTGEAMMDKPIALASLALAGALPFAAAAADVTTATIVAPATTAPVYVAPTTVAPASDLVVVQMEPPAPRVEDTPAPREGYVWAPGYWSWDGSNYVWV